MEANLKINLSVEARNRIELWQLMIEKAYAYLLIDNKMGFPNEKDFDLCYTIDSRNFKHKSKYLIKNALKE